LKLSCDGDIVDCSGAFQYTGGTGKYQSASGSNSFKARNTGNRKDGNVSGFATRTRWAMLSPTALVVPM
jgi:hypothetical protein